MADNKTSVRITAKDETRAAIASAIAGFKGFESAANRLPLIGPRLAAALSGGAFLATIKSTIDGADQLAKASQKYGIAVEELSALSYAGKLADVSLEAIGKGLKQLSVNMLDTARGTGDAKDAFKALGIEVKGADGSLKSSDAVLAEIADKFAGMEDGAGKTALAMRIFGKAGADMIPMLNAGSKGLAEMREEAQAFGAIVGGDLARKSEEFNDNLTRINTAFEAFKIAIANSALPALNAYIEKIVVLTKAADGFWDVIKTFGTINPFRNNQENIRAYADELAGIEQRLQYSIPAAERASLEASAATLRKRLGYLKEIARVEANALISDDNLDARDLALRGMGSGKAPAPLLAGKGGSDAAAKKAAEEARKAFEAYTKALYDNAMAGIAADKEITRLRNSYVDMFEPAAKTMRELAKFEELAPALGLTAEQVERIRDAFHEKINVEQYGKPLKDITEEVKKQDDLVRDLGLTFSSAFEDAVIGGKKFQEVLKGIAQDIARIVLRKTVTEPMGDAISGWFKDILPSFGGGRAGGGAVYPGQYYVVGEKGPEVLVPNTAGRVIPHGAGGGATYNTSIVVNADGGSNVQSDAAQGAELGRRLDAAVRTVLMAERRPGGLLAGG